MNPKQSGSERLERTRAAAGMRIAGLAVAIASDARVLPLGGPALVDRRLIARLRDVLEENGMDWRQIKRQ
jgi:hypothetical protein